MSKGALIKILGVETLKRVSETSETSETMEERETFIYVVSLKKGEDGAHLGGVASIRERGL